MPETRMIAVLLCAGFGVRMHPLTTDFPKPLLEVAGRPMLDYLVDQLRGLAGLDEIHVVSNHRFLRHFVKWQKRWERELDPSGPRIRLHDDGVRQNEHRLGLVGDLAFVLAAAGVPDGAFVAAGDNILRFGLLPLWLRFRETRRNYVVALRETDPDLLRRTAVLELDDDGRVFGFHEKPQAPPSHWTSPALYVLERQALQRAAALRLDGLDEASGHLIATLLRQMPIHALRIEGTRLHVGSLAAYDEADRVLREEAVIVNPNPAIG